MQLNPKFAALKNLSIEDIARETEIGLTKLRYEVTRIELEERQKEIEIERANGEMHQVTGEDEKNVNKEVAKRLVYDPFSKKVDYAKKTGNRP